MLKSDYMCEQKLKLYHCNTTQNINKVLINKQYSILRSNNDRYWLGNGIYFWDNLGNAKYWQREKIRKNENNKDFSIGVALVSLENVFDLTSEVVMKELENFFEGVYKVNCRLKNKGFGDKINFFIENNPEFCNKFHVIKAIGRYPNIKTTLYYFNRKKASLTPKGKIIYNVINDSSIIKFNEKVD